MIKQNDMKTPLLLIFLFLGCMAVKGQTNNTSPTTLQSAKELKIKDSFDENMPFKGKIENAEYQVWFELNCYDNNITIKDQAVLGAMPGYMGAKRDTRKWIIIDATISENKATLTLINDYGSEDLTAELTYQGNGTFLLQQKEGSPLRIVVDKKWVKLPKKLIFKAKQP